MHPVDHIRKFATLSPQLEDDLRKVMREHHLRRGEIIQGAKNLVTYTYYMTEGSARVFYTERGREHTVSFAFDNQFVLLPRHLLKEHYDTVAIQALEPSKVIFIPHLRIKSLLEESGSVTGTDTGGLLFLATALMEYSRFLEERVEVMQTFNAVERYNWALRRYPRLEGCATITQIASFLGVTKETLYRIKSGRYAGVRPGKADASKQQKKDDN